MANQITDKRPHELLGEGRPPATTRERILEHAQDLFYSRGFQAVGIDAIADEAGVTRATFYNHFSSRDALIVEVIKRSDRLLHRRFMEAVRDWAGWDPGAGLPAMFDVLDEWFNHPDYRGCLFLAACIAFPMRHDPIHQAAGAHYLVTGQDIAKMAAALRVPDPDEFAAEWVLLIEGALAQRAIAHDDGSARRARRLAESTLNGWLVGRA